MNRKHKLSVEGDRYLNQEKEQNKVEYDSRYVYDSALIQVFIRINAKQ